MMPTWLAARISCAIRCRRHREGEYRETADPDRRAARASGNLAVPGNRDVKFMFGKIAGDHLAGDWIVFQHDQSLAALRFVMRHGKPRTWFRIQPVPRSPGFRKSHNDQLKPRLPWSGAKTASGR